jgi:phenylalanyl-tRNA synthetase beta chain
MRVSLAWVARLLDVADLGVTPEVLAERLSVRVAEIEEVQRLGGLEGVVVGKVREVRQHPNADRLRCCVVDVGGPEPLPIVCGAPNVAAGQTVAVATIGTKLTMPGKDGVPAEITIKAGKLRGEPSHGMICAEDELGLGDGHDGILVLDDRHAAGTPLLQALGKADAVLLIDNHNINHRPDLWGQLGWAREIALLLGLPAPATPSAQWQDQPGAALAPRLDDAGCSRWCGAVVEGVSDGPSPAWMQALLTAAGVRPLSRLIDITNYVMLELGHPMHAFDRRSLADGVVVARPATAGETISTLDGRSHTLAAGDLLIADGAGRPLALAGIMGGANSGVAADTTAIVLEAAVFDPARIRRARLRTGLATDSSGRFEKGLPAEQAAAAIARACTLLAELCPGCQVTARAAAGATPTPPAVLPLADDAVAQRLGLAVPADEQRRILLALGLMPTAAGWQVPWWRRKDLTRAVDLVEEIGRHHGYEHIVPDAPRLPARLTPRQPLRAAARRVRRHLAALAWDEVATPVFHDLGWAEATGAAASALELVNPAHPAGTHLRTGLLPLLLTAVAANRRHLPAVRLYEIGKAYGQDGGSGDTPCERWQVAGAVSCADDDTPYYAARDAALSLLESLDRPAQLRAASATPTGLVPGRVAELLVDGRVVGVIGEADAALRARAELSDGRAGIFVLELERLLAELPPAPPRAFRAVPRIAPVDREFTFVCPEDLAYGRLAETVEKSAGNLARGSELVTIWRGEGLPAAHKAVSIRIWLGADDRLPSEAELAKTQQRIIADAQRTLGIALRS